MGLLWDRGRSVARHPVAVLVFLGLVTVVLALAIPRIGFGTSLEALIGEDDPRVEDNRAAQEIFGGEPMVILLTAEDDRTVAGLFAEENLTELRRLVQQLEESGSFPRILSPLDALEFGAAQIEVGPDLFAVARQRAEDVAAQEARVAGDGASAEAETVAAVGRRVDDALTEQAQRLGPVTETADESGLDDPFVAENPAFVDLVVFEDASRETVRSALVDVFPDPTHAVIVARFPPNIDLDRQAAGVGDLEAIVAAADFDGFTVTGGGPASIVRDLNDYLRSGLATLGAAALIVMALVLWFVFRVRWRLLSLGVVLIGSVWSFGIIALSGVPLSIITISGLPILIGIGVDFSIQVQSRLDEELEQGASIGDAVGTVWSRLLPALAVAMLSAVLGFVALQVSASQAIREFGVLLAVGIAAMFVVGVLFPVAVLVCREERWPAPVEGDQDGVLGRWAARLARSGLAVFWPLVVGSAVVIVIGLSLNDSTPIQTDAEEWVPADNQRLQDLGVVRDATGWSSELSFVIEAQDVTDPEVVAWMSEFVATELERHPGSLARGNSLPRVAEAVTGLPAGAEEVEVLIGSAHDPRPVHDVTPSAILDTFVTADETRANVVFQIGRVELSDLRGLIEEIERDLDPPPGVEVSLVPPEGVEVTTAGLAIVGTSVVRTFEANRSLLTWVALGAVAAWLAVAYHRPARVILPLVPVMVAVGMSAIVTTVMGVQLSPMTALTGPLIIATCTEFAVLIMARYSEERAAGHDPAVAVHVGVARIGRAFMASGLTTVGGFAVLAFSSYPLLRDFGVLVAVNVVVALLSALVVLPSLLVRFDRWVVPGGDVDA